MTSHDGPSSSLGLREVNSLRLSRDDLEKWVRTTQGFEDLPKGCFVRVLLEGDENRRKYRLARIEDYEVAPQPYVFGNITTTSTLLSLNFGAFNAAYQMNTISNSSILQTEVDEWVKLMSGKLRPLEWLELYTRKRARIAAFRGRSFTAATSSGPNSPMDAEEELSRLNTIPRTAHEMDLEQATVVGAGHQTKRRMVDKFDGMQRDALVTLLRQKEAVVLQQEQQIEKLREQLSVAVMPMDLDALSLAELTAVEGRAEQYWRRVRALLAEKAKCTICMERESEIIFYPCKHAITCEQCSTAVKSCPMCRAAIHDRIKPYK